MNTLLERQTTKKRRSFCRKLQVSFEDFVDEEGSAAAAAGKRHEEDEENNCPPREQTLQVTVIVCGSTGKSVSSVPARRNYNPCDTILAQGYHFTVYWGQFLQMTCSRWAKGPKSKELLFLFLGLSVMQMTWHAHVGQAVVAIEVEAVSAIARAPDRQHIATKPRFI